MMEDIKLKSQVGRALQLYNATAVPHHFECKTCKQIKNGTHSTNLVTHYKFKHTEIYARDIAISTEEHIQVQRLNTIHSCVELVTINSQPFSILSSSGFRHALESKLREYQLAGWAINLTNHHVYEIKDKIRECRSKIEEQIELETKNKVISLMVDSATRNGRSIFGVNIQYHHNGKLRLVTLAMYELKKSHTAKYLGDVVISVLSRYTDLASSSLLPASTSLQPSHSI